jgi:hypothetical protein
MRYLLNGFLLVIPLLVFDAAFASRLPAAYRAAQWNDVPALVALPEGVLRVGTMLLTLLPASAGTPTHGQPGAHTRLRDHRPAADGRAPPNCYAGDAAAISISISVTTGPACWRRRAPGIRIGTHRLRQDYRHSQDYA